MIKLGDIKLFSIAELSKKLNVTPTTMRTYIKTGRIKGEKVGGKWYVSEDALKEFFQGQAIPQAQ